MMEDDTRNILYQDYSATCLGMLGRIIGHENWTLPPFIEMAYPKKEKPNDFRTKDQIVHDLLEKLRE